MKILILSTLFFFARSSFACEIKNQKKIISLSASVTYVFEKLGLVNNLQAVSMFHPVQSKGVQKLQGGIYLSPKILTELKPDILFFDESKEQEKTFEKLFISQKIEIKTKNKDPFVIHKNAVDQVSPLLTKCEQKLEKLDMEIANPAFMHQSGKVFYFFIGKLSPNKYPQYVLGQDTFVKAMVDKKIIESYPTNLPIVNSSKQIIDQAIASGAVMIGLDDSENSKFKIQKISKQHYNIFDQRALLPGGYQIEFIQDFLQNMENFRE